MQNHESLVMLAAWLPLSGLKGLGFLGRRRKAA
jgi:uncharacterized protein (TIGR03382 family)